MTIDPVLITTDPSQAEQLRLASEEMSTPALTTHVKSLGFEPPTADPGWSAAYAFGPDGEDIGVVWAPPSYPDD